MDGRGHAGVTLLEVVVAVAIGAAVTAATAQVVGVLVGRGIDQGHRTVATALAVQKLEEVRARPEAQATALARIRQFDCLYTDAPRAFPPPYADYSYTVVIGEVEGVPPDALPPWLTPAPADPCRPPPGAHGDQLRWVGVVVTFRGRPLASVTSAVLRELR
jgi:prepilin-type N-terminal cleavage/methylation domain-containing protein